MKLPSRSPATTRTSSSPCARPTYWIRLSNWSLQKNGTGAYGVGWFAGELGQEVPSRGLALLGGVRPVLDAHLLAGLAEQVVDPSGTIPCGVDPWRGPQRLGRRRRRRGPPDHCPRATRSPATRRSRPRRRRRERARRHPGERRSSVRRAPSIPATCTPQRTSTPLRACTLATTSPISAPRPRIIGAEAPLEHRHRAPALGRRRGDLEADEPGADDDDAWPSFAVARRSASESSSVRSIVTPSRSG